MPVIGPGDRFPADAGKVEHGEGGASGHDQMVDRLRAVRQPPRVQHDSPDMAQLIEGATSTLLSTQLNEEALLLRRPAPARVQLTRARELIRDRSSRHSGVTGDLVRVMTRRRWAL